MHAFHTAASLGPWFGQRLRRLAVVVLCSLCATFGLVLTLHLHWPAEHGRFQSHTGNPIGADFLAFHTAGKLAAEGKAKEAYDLRAFTDTLAQATSAPAPLLPWAYPPPVFAMVSAFGALPPWPSFILWYLMMAVLACLGCSLAWKSHRIGVLALAYPGVQLLLANGQIAALSLVCLGGAVRWWKSRPFIAGLCLGLMCFKPQLAFGPLLLMALDRNRIRGGFGALLGGVLLLTLSAPFGVQVWTQFYEALGPHARYLETGAIQLPRVATIYGWLRTLGLEHGPALIGHALAAGMALLLAGIRLRCANLPEPSRALALVAAALLCTPYLIDYDFALLALPFSLLLFRLGPSPDRWGGEEFWLAFALALTPSLGLILAKTTGLSIAGPFLLGILILGAQRGRAAPIPIGMRTA